MVSINYYNARYLGWIIFWLPSHSGSVSTDVRVATFGFVKTKTGRVEYNSTNTQNFRIPLFWQWVLLCNGRQYHNILLLQFDSIFFFPPLITIWFGVDSVFRYEPGNPFHQSMYVCLTEDISHLNYPSVNDFSLVIPFPTDITLLLLKHLGNTNPDLSILFQLLGITDFSGFFRSVRIWRYNYCINPDFVWPVISWILTMRKFCALSKSCYWQDSFQHDSWKRIFSPEQIFMTMNLKLLDMLSWIQNKRLCPGFRPCARMYFIQLKGESHILNFKSDEGLGKTVWKKSRRTFPRLFFQESGESASGFRNNKPYFLSIRAHRSALANS